MDFRISPDCGKSLYKTKRPTRGRDFRYVSSPGIGTLHMRRLPWFHRACLSATLDKISAYSFSSAPPTGAHRCYILLYHRKCPIARLFPKYFPHTKKFLSPKNLHHFFSWGNFSSEKFPTAHLLIKVSLFSETHQKMKNVRQEPG